MVCPKRSKPMWPGASMKALGVSIGPDCAEAVEATSAKTARDTIRRRENKGVFLKTGFCKKSLVPPGRYTRDLEHIQGGSETVSLLEPPIEGGGPPPHPAQPAPGGPVR